MSETLDWSDVVARIPELLNRTARGEWFEIIKDGRPIARLVPPASFYQQAPGGPMPDPWQR